MTKKPADPAAKPGHDAEVGAASPSSHPAAPDTAAAGHAPRTAHAPITIAVDAMGGDNAPSEIVKAVAALSLEPSRSGSPVHTVLVGDAGQLNALLSNLRHDAERIAVRHASQVVTMDESPREALVHKPDASIAVAARLCAHGQAAALVSAGHTGAAVFACQQPRNRLQGVRRCPLAAVYPTELRRGEKDDPFSLILDVGATLDVTADDLVSFAVMGAAYAARISGHPRPRVALLSNGTEAGKGPKEVVAAHQRLKQHPGLNFIGNIEGVDIPRGSADVVVCNGFVGNVVLKMLEGVSETVVRLASYAYKEKLMWRAGLAMLSGGIGKLKDLTDWKQYGGAPLLGFDRLLIKAHGRSQAHAVQNAIKVATKSVATGLQQEIEAGLRQAAALATAPPEPTKPPQEPT